MNASSPAVATLQHAQDITARWLDGELGAEQAQQALKSLFEQWQAGEPDNEVEAVAQASLTAARIAFHDWLQRGENCEELVAQLRWILDPSKDGMTDPELKLHAPHRHE